MLKNFYGYVKTAHQAGVKMIGDLVNNRDELMDYQQFIEKFGQVATMMQFNSLVTAIPRKWKDHLKEDVIDTKYVLRYENIETKTVGKIYQNMVQDPSLMVKLKDKWETKLNCTLDSNRFQDVFFNLYKCVPHPKLRSFQYRFLHRRIFLNNILYKWKISSTSRCFYCQEHYETMDHLFWQCRVARCFWELLQNWFEYVTDTVLNLTCLDVMLCQTEDSTLNTVLICAKQFIFSRRIQEKYMNFYIFKDKLKEIAKFEKVLAYQRNTKAGWVRFNKKWHKIALAKQSCKP